MASLDDDDRVCCPIFGRFRRRVRRRHKPVVPNQTMPPENKLDDDNHDDSIEFQSSPTVDPNQTMPPENKLDDDNHDDSIAYLAQPIPWDLLDQPRLARPIRIDSREPPQRMQIRHTPQRNEEQAVRYNTTLAKLQQTTDDISAIVNQLDQQNAPGTSSAPSQMPPQGENSGVGNEERNEHTTRGNNQ